MKIGIDISQTAYKGTGVGTLVKNLVLHLLQIDKNNEYILFFSSFRGSIDLEFMQDVLSYKNVAVRIYKFPPVVLDILWNKLHILPIEWFIGDIDVFISSDWVQSPTVKAKKATILYDLIVYKHPEETAKKIVDVQKRRLAWVKKECDAVLCISESTKKDAMEILKIEEKKLKVIYPGI